MKKTLAIVSALVLVLLMAVPAFAADPEISAPANTKNSYKVFQVFTGTVSDNKLVDVKYGANAALTGTEKVGDAVPAATLNAIAALEGTDAVVAASVAAYCNMSSTPFKTLNSTTTSASVPSGYYLIQEVLGAESEDKTVSINMVKVLSGDLTITRKGTNVPSLDKELVDAQGNNPAKAGEAKPGDTVYFKVTVTLPSDMDKYPTYKLNILDTLSESLTYNNDAVMTKGTDVVTGSFTPDIKTQSLKWSCADAKKIASAGDTIIVKYSANLNDKYVMGSTGNKNEAYCQYSNNPNNTNELGETPKKTVKVFNFEMKINKVNDKTPAEPVTGAVFTLSKKNDAGNYVLVEKLGDVTAISTFEFKGLTSGDYKLEETAPSGYNAIAPIEFKVTASEEDGVITYTCDNANFGYTAATGILAADIVNTQGSNLPTTGGIGTYIFTGLGAALVLAAVIVLVSKKKAEKLVG